MAQSVTIMRSSAPQRTAEGQSSTRISGNALIRSVAAIFFAAACFGLPGAGCRSAVAAPVASESSTQSSGATSIYHKMRGLDLATSRDLATKRSSSIALSGTRIGAAEADLAELRNRIKINTAGGLGVGTSPLQSGGGGGVFTPKVQLYLSLDLERLLQLNKAQRTKAKRLIEAENIGKTTATNGAIKDVTTAWYAMQRANAGVISAIRYRESSHALYVSADAKFRAGTGELSGVLAALDATYKSDEAYAASRHTVALACLDLAQACGYTTAEEMEAAL